MPSEMIHIRFSPGVDGSRELARAATDIAFDFIASYPDRANGLHHCVVYKRHGYVWRVYRPRDLAVAISCEYKVEGAP